MSLASGLLRLCALPRLLRRATRAGGRFVLALNYHRIASPDDPAWLRHAHAVAPDTFRRQVAWLARLARPVSLARVCDADRLGRLNLLLTFDDVSQSIDAVVPWLRAKQIPYAVCPATGILDTGYGPRDRVYLLLESLPPATLYERCRAVFGDEEAGPLESFSFYAFTRRPHLCPDRLETEVILPLLDRVPDWEARLRGAAEYLDWGRLRTDFASDPLCTIVNHGHSHRPYGALSAADLADEMDTSAARFTEELGRAPRDFAVPFGRVRRPLIDELNALARVRHLRSVLWVEGAATIVAGPARSQIVHLSRMHTDPSFTRFLRQTGLNLHAATRRVVDLASPVAAPSRALPRLIESSDPAPALAFENLVRQGKNYASDAAYYDYCFTRNPDKGDRPDYYAAAVGDRFDAIGYNFHTRFSARGEAVDGIYWANWRVLPGAHPLGGALLLRKAMESAPVIGAPKPSDEARGALRDDRWHPIDVYALDVPVLRVRGDASPALQTHTSCPDTLEPLLETVNRAADLTLDRSVAMFRWRLDTYPLATSAYHVLASADGPVAYLAVLYGTRTAQVVDYWMPGPAVERLLLGHLAEESWSRGLRRIRLETSDENFASRLHGAYRAPRTAYRHYYAFSPDAPCASLQETWHDLTFHETALCGDVLLREG